MSSLPFGSPRQAFRLSADPTFYFDGDSRRETRRRFNTALDVGTAVIVLSGDIGAGKTMMLREALARLAESPDIVIASVVTSQLDSAELRRVAFTQFGCMPRDASPLNLERALSNFLTCLSQAGQRALLTIDEAQNLSADAFVMLGEWVRLARERDLPMQLCLVGQRELNPIMQSTSAQALRSGEIVFCPIGPLDADEIRAYIRHRLDAAGWINAPRFTGPALQVIQQWTRGVPRKINLLCNLLLTHDAPAQASEIGPELVDAAVRTLDLGIDPNSDPDLARNFAAHDSSTTVPSILCVVGGNGDCVKAAAVWRQLSQQSTYAFKIVSVYAGEVLRRNLELFEAIDGERDVIALNVPAGPSTSPLLMHRMLYVIQQNRPAAVIVFDGSTAAFTTAALARRDGVRVLHVGGGTRMSEIGLVQTDTSKLTDDLSDVIYADDPGAVERLLGEGFAEERVVCVGSLLADTFLHTPAMQRVAAPASRANQSFLSKPMFANGYALVRLNHPANTDSRDTLIRLMGILKQISKDMPLVWPIAPRVVQRLESIRSSVALEWDGMYYVDELPYSQFADLLCNAECAITDSWKVQEEASVVGTPCITIGTINARASTMGIGSNASTGMDARAAVRALWDVRFNAATSAPTPEIWDGKAGQRLADHLIPWVRINQLGGAGRWPAGIE